MIYICFNIFFKINQSVQKLLTPPYHDKDYDEKPNGLLLTHKKTPKNPNCTRWFDKENFAEPMYMNWKDNSYSSM